MSLITQCPACNTLFKVVADQLKISQGWVRCGQCKEVFDANAHIAQSQPVHAEPEPTPEPEAPSPFTASQWQSFAPSPNMPGTVSSSYGSLPEELTDSDPYATSEDYLSAPKVVTAKAFSSKPEFASSDWVNSVNPPRPLQPSASVDEVESQNFETESVEALMPHATSAAEPAATPSFVRQAQQAQRWRSPWVRAMLGFCAVLLMVLGALQVALQERDRIVATYPRAQGVMADLCRWAGCSLGPLKQIEAIVVDASSFNKIRSDNKSELYKVTLNLKNNGPLTVALPHIELSLNDTQDQTIVRRVLNPADIGAVQFVLPARGEFNGSAVVQVDSAQLGGLRVTGYRIWAFYPS